MDFSNLFFVGLAIFAVGYLIYAANQYDMAAVLVTPDSGSDLMHFIQRRGKIVRRTLYALAAVNFLFALLIFQVALFKSSGDALPEVNVEMPAVDMTGALFNLVLAGVVTVICVRTTARESARGWVRPLAGYESGYRPRSAVHQVALVLALCLISFTIGELQLAGGLAGVAQQIADDGSALGPQVFQTVVMIVVALLGVGLALRRNWAQTAQRLGLRLPTLDDLKWGIGMGIALFIAQVAMVELWYYFVPAEQIAQQSAASDQIGQVYSTIPLALFLASTAAVSEEILFRGALQPIFGIGLSSLFFAMVHIQYSLTPATAIIFVVSLGLGWLRNRQSTTAAILAHFTYNFVVMVIAMTAASALGGGQ